MQSQAGMSPLSRLPCRDSGEACSPSEASTPALVTEGFSTGVAPGGDPSSNNIFGADVKRVVSNSVPAGVAILGDFSKLRIYVREDASLAIDSSGVLFTKNQFVCRGEGRFGIGVLRPSAFAICDLTA